MMLQRWWRWIGLLNFRLKRAEFYRDMSEMFRRNEALMSFFEGEIANAVRTRQGSRAAALRLMLARYQSGENSGRVGYLLEAVMPRCDSMMLAGLDRASDKAQALVIIAEAVDRQMEMRAVMLTQATLPAILLPLSYGLIKVLGDVILSIEKSTPVYVQDLLWTGANGWARSLARLTSDHGLLCLVLMMLLALAAVLSLPRWRGRGRLAIDGWPIYSLYRDFQAGLLLTSMAMLIKTGGTLKGSLEDIAQSSSLWMRWQLGRVLRALDDNPTGTIEAFGRGLLSPHLLARAATLQRTSASFSDVLVELGTSEGERVLARVKRGAVVANAAIVGVSVLVAAFMGIASLTVPGRFSALMEPNSLMGLKQAHEAKQKLPP
ncbi:MAG: hypothetical protein RLZZ618_3887 [Pseudomonadota bacterium]|jgi:type II secretory pathway component PulF